MTPRELYIKLDRYLIDGSQNSYLWLLDRTGVYLATILMVAHIGSFACLTLRDGKLSWLWMGFVLILGLGDMIRYWWQEKEQYDAINAGAMEFEAWKWRHFGNGWFIAMLLLDLIRLTPWDAGFDICLLGAQYLMTVKVRKQDKKPFFEKKEQLALEGSS